MEKHEDKIIPDQRIGNKLDTGHEHLATSREEAAQIFSTAVDRLLNVNIWEKICGPLSAKFTLTDENGSVAHRTLKPGDHFRIDIPGPGPSAGDGFDWVQVEALDDERNPSAEDESVTVRVRPASSPKNNAPDIAHFFKEDATSSFRVQRIGNLVRAEVHGRNEIPNTKTGLAKDKVRNAMVGASAVAGASKPQWKSLVKGLLDQSIDSGI
jgi:hypothetical protein